MVAIHSFKGGTGKTIIATNLATIYASKGKNTCILDLDLRAPSLGITFKDKAKYTINDFLDGRCEINDAILNMKEKYATKGDFYVGLANHSTEAIQKIIAKDRKWEMKALQNLISMKKTLLNEMNLDYVLLDTSPGVQYSSINAISTADIVLLVTAFDESDIDGTKKMIHSIYEPLEKKVNFIVNKAPPKILTSEHERNNFIKMINPTLKKPILNIIPCYCDVLQSKRSNIFALEKPKHHFTKKLHELSEQIVEI